MKAKKEDTVRIRHFLADGTEVPTMKGRVIPLTEETRPYYSMIVDMGLREIKKKYVSSENQSNGITEMGGMKIGMTVTFIKNIECPWVAPGEMGTIESFSRWCDIVPLAIVAFKNAKVRSPLFFFEEYAQVNAEYLCSERE